ncbi:MAG: hypothetical protein KDK70_43185 [Myxococcales bacterium]|nr:hypothetical protein [Myxococcales bacterium]
MSRALSLGLALLLAAAPCVALAAPAVSLDVDVSALPEDDVTEALETRLVEHQVQTLRDSGLEVVDDAGTRIRVVVSRYGDNDVHYRATVTLLDADGEPAEAERTLDCELCRDSELIAKVGEEIARLSGKVLYAPSSEAETDAKPEQDESGPEPTGSTGEQPKKLETLGYVGIGALVVGAGALGAGVGLALQPDEARLQGTRVERRSTRAPGFAMVGLGSAVLVTGAVLLTIDLVRRKKQRKVALIPTVTPSMITLGMHMRF